MHVEYILRMPVYSEQRPTHTDKNKMLSNALQFHMHFTIRTECTGSLMPLDGSSYTNFITPVQVRKESVL